MNLSTSTFVLLATLSFGSSIFGSSTMFKSHARSEQKTDKANLSKFMPLWDEDGKSVADLQGVWQVKGYGMIVEIKEAGVRIFNIYPGGGWEEKLDEKPDLFYRLGDDAEKCQLAFHPLDGYFNVVRLKELPESCRQDIEWNPTKVFDAFSKTMAEYYAFFDVYEIDWAQRSKDARANIGDSTSEQELFNTFKQLLDGVDDAHTRLIAEIDGKRKVIRLGEAKTLDKLRAKHKSLGAKESFGEFMDSRIATYFEGVEEFLGSKPKQTANQLLWGKTKDSVGYIMVKGMGGFAEGEDIDGQLVALHKGLDEILKELADTKGMIIDVSLNGGGMDLFSVAIASRFADQRRLGFSKYPANHEHYRRNVFVKPYVGRSRGKLQTYTKPIFVVTSDVTVSAAEIFVMCMRSMPHVKTAGTTTRGAHSDVLEKTLPNGWGFGFSNEIYLDHENVCHEGKGIDPNISLSLFEITDDAFTHSAALEKLANLISR